MLFFERELSGQVAVVTGAAQGIGQAVAAALAAHGATVAGIDRQPLSLEHGFVADIRDQAALEAGVAAIEEQHGPITILAHCAGVFHGAPALDLRIEQWRETLEINATGTLLVLQSVGRRMAQRGRGSIVVVGSNAAGVPRKGMGAYAASKAAAEMVTRCLGLELAERGVRCNIVAPGSTDTAMQHALWHDEHGAERVIRGSLEDYRLGIPLGRIAAPADIAEAVVFLASERARHITLQTLCVDGGATLGAI